MIAPFSQDEILILGGLVKNNMKLGNGIILNTKELTATKIETNQTIFYSGLCSNFKL